MKRTNGFTLIELLAVIVILGVIMIIAVPAVANYITKSKNDSFILTAKAYIDAAEKAIANSEYEAPNSTTDTPLIILLSDLDISNSNAKSPFGYSYLKGSYIKVTSDNNGSLVFSITAFDEGNNAIIDKTLQELNSSSSTIIKKTTPEAENIVLPRSFAVGDKVTLKDGGGSFTVIKEAKAGSTSVTLFADYVVKKDLSGLDSTCTGTAPYCSVIQFDSDAYNAVLDLSSTTSDNIGYYVTNYQISLRTKYSDTAITVDLPTIQTILNLTNAASLDAIRAALSKTGNTRDLNLQTLNLPNINILYNGQNYWFNSIYVDADSGRNWYWYARDSYGKVLDAYWASHDSMAGLRPIVNIPITHIN